ncbi:hypothetical protein Rhal01_02888 [Rubritalea halochordaticola]|uniref:LamG-like jellyroll fold domain-containing protein n=1 Tax=Rubritalea halochordaticola TaxID=714537 RepID=A0ABP9V1Z4_9BACT
MNKLTKYLLIPALAAGGYFSYPYLYPGDQASAPTQEEAEVTLRPQPPVQEFRLKSTASPVFREALPSTSGSWSKTGVKGFTQGRKVSDTHAYFVLKPDTEQGSSFGLFAVSGRPWDNFLSMSFNKDGSISFGGESGRGGRVGAHLKAELSPKPGDPFLLELHPNTKNVALLVNGQAAGAIPADMSANVFGANYPNRPSYKGEIGEVRFYDKGLTADQQEVERTLLSTFWQLPGSQEGAFQDGYRLEPAILTKKQTSAQSAGLSLQSPHEIDQPVFIAASEPAPPVIEGLPRFITIAAGRSWNISSLENAALDLSFSADTLPAYYLGEHGFYSLLHRPDSQSDWKEISITRPTAEGLVQFQLEQSPSGQYTLAISQGIPVKPSSATIQLVKQDQLIPGRAVSLKCSGAEAGQELTLLEPETHTVWYQGKAADLDLSFTPLRKREIRLIATYTGTPRVLGSKQELTLKIDPEADSLYPGLIAEIIKADKDIQLPLTATSFQSKASWPERYASNLKQKGYPAYRTAESIHTPPLTDNTKQWFNHPDYFHSILPTLNMAQKREDMIANGAYVQYPLGDLVANRHTRIHGSLLLEQASEYHFLLKCNVPGSLTIAGQSVTDFAAVSYTAQSPTTLPLELFVTTSEENPRLFCQFLWKKPGDSEFTSVPASALYHQVSPVREQALADATGQMSYRRFQFSKSSDDAAALKLIESWELAKHCQDANSFASALNVLTKAYQSGKTLSANQDLAAKVFELIEARIQHIRKTPDQVRVKGFGKTDGRMMRAYEAALPFLSHCENVPGLQMRALDARGELAQYAISTCLHRSFFSEVHHGANDGYSDDHNLLVNFWRAARCLDDPYAWDAAACLQDSHFRYAAGRGEGLLSDGIFGFHHANGRHVHVDGYGANWFSRVCGGGRSHSPWGYTAEQYRRLTEYVRAFEWFFYHGTDAFVTNGRHNDHRGSNGVVNGFAARLLAVPKELQREEDRQELQALQKRIKDNPGNSITGNRFFYRALFTVHRRKDYYIDLKMISPMAGPPETFAGAIPWNMSFGDGVTTLMRSGQEYHDIHRNHYNGSYSAIRAAKQSGIKNVSEPSLWFYRQLPGTTQLDDEMHQPDRYRGGSGATAGGVSDGELGHNAFHFRNGRTGSDVRKFYAFTDDGMLVMNTGITTTRTKGVPADVTMRSTINQCDWRSDITVMDENGFQRTFKHDSAGEKLSLPLNRRYWVLHNGIGYLVLPTGNEAGAGKEGTLEIEFGVRTPLTPAPGYQLPEKAAQALIEQKFHQSHAKKIFQLSINHSQQVKDADCAYFVCMRGDQVNAAEWLKQPPLQILSNTPSLQAVMDTRDRAVQAFFREAGKLKDPSGNLLIASPTPCSVMWRPSKSSVTVQDPIAACTSDTSKMIDTMKVTLGTGLHGIESNQELAIPLSGMNDPDDRYRGKPETITIH